MFSSSANYTKLKTNLRLVINRLKLLEKKKTEMALKARKEIADYIQSGKDDRARIRVEHIVREDYLVEAMEMVEMYCDLILARFGLISSQKELDPGLEEAVATIIWVTPRLQADVQELKSVAEQFSVKYSKEFAQACLQNSMNNVSEKVMHKMSVQAPPKILVERYMMEIAKSYGVAFTPDAMVMKEDEFTGAPDLLDIDPPFNRKPGGSGGSGGSSFPPVPSSAPAGVVLQHGGVPNPGSFNPPGPHPGYPSSNHSSGSYPSPYPPPPPANYVPGNLSQATGGQEMPPPYSYDSQNAGPIPNKGSGTNLGLPELPNVPSSPASSVQTGPGAPSNEVDFDDLSRRFEDLKRRK